MCKREKEKRSDLFYRFFILSKGKAVLPLCHLVKATMGQLKNNELFPKIIKRLHWQYVLKVKRNIEFALIFHSLVVENRNRKMGRWVLFPFGLFDFPNWPHWPIFPFWSSKNHKFNFPLNCRTNSGWNCLSNFRNKS